MEILVDEKELEASKINENNEYFEAIIGMKSTDKNGKPIKPKHTYTVEITRAIFSEEKFEVYKKYQKHIHNKEDDKATFDRFLCQSPLFDPRDQLIPQNVTQQQK